jgi:hypothetical protein
VVEVTGIQQRLLYYRKELFRVSEDKTFSGFFDGSKLCSGNPPTRKVTDEDYTTTYCAYPELTPDANRKCSVCSKLPMRSDSLCIRHTRKNLKHYNIPWMCTAIKANNKRCTQVVLEGELYCSVHYKKKDIPYMGRTKLTKQHLHDKAMISNNPDDWKSLLPAEINTPRDLVKILEETLNRFRYGTIDRDQVSTIPYRTKKALDIMVTSKESGLDEIVTAVPEKRFTIDTGKVISLQDKLDKAVQKKEAITKQTDCEETKNG